MKVVVTGGAGFIGSHLVDELLLKGAEVHVLDNLVSGQLANINPEATIHIVDICSEKARHIITQEKPDYVFHLAAQADVGKSVQDPLYDAGVNINGTINILEASRNASVKKIIFASTSAVYGNLEKGYISEEDLTVPTSYYGLSKLTAESYIRLYYDLYQLPYTILRYGNVYGPRQLPKGEGGVVAVFLDRIKRQRLLSIHGDGEQTRDFIYVTDVVSANIAALERGTQQTIQISTSKRTSINELVSKFSDLNELPFKTICTTQRTGDIKHSCLNNKKAIQLLEWLPTVEISEGLAETYKSELLLREGVNAPESNKKRGGNKIV